MSLVRRVASASVLAVAVTGAVLSLTGVAAANAETGWPNSLPAGASSTPPVVTCCAGGPSLENGGFSGYDPQGSAPVTASGDDQWKGPGPFATADGSSDRWAISASYESDQWK